MALVCCVFAAVPIGAYVLATQPKHAKTWYMVARASEVPKRGSKVIAVDTMFILLIRSHGELFAYDAKCPHFGIILSWDADTNEIMGLPSHGGRFDVYGKRLSKVPPADLTRFPVREADGYIFANLKQRSLPPQ